MKSPEDIRKQGHIWKLRKPLYGLHDTSRKFWLKVKEVFLDLNLKVMDRDEAFYYLYENNELKGAVQTHVENFSLAGTSEFIEKIIEGVPES